MESEFSNDQFEYIHTIKITEILLLSVAEHSDTFTEKTNTKSKKTLELKLTNSMEIFPFDRSESLEIGEWM